MIYSVIISGLLVLLPYILKFKYLIAHFYYGMNLTKSLDESLLFVMMKDVQQYYQQIVWYPARDDLLRNKFGTDITSIILQYLPTLHEIFYVE